MTVSNFLPEQYKQDNQLKINHNYLQQQFSDSDVILQKIKQMILQGDFTLGKDMIWAPRMRSIIQKYKNDPNGAETLHRLYDLHKRYTTPSALKKAILNKDLSQEDAADLIRIMQNQ